jgi:hypothetical protein
MKMQFQREKVEQYKNRDFTNVCKDIIHYMLVYEAYHVTNRMQCVSLVGKVFLFAHVNIIFLYAFQTEALSENFNSMLCLH